MRLQIAQSTCTIKNNPEFFAPHCSLLKYKRDTRAAITYYYLLKLKVIYFLRVPNPPALYLANCDRDSRDVCRGIDTFKMDHIGG